MSDAINAQLDALYARLPSISCRGLCWDSCVSIDMSNAERTRIARARAGVDIPLVHRRCPALTPFGRCSVYNIRPLICRIYALTRSLPCTHGCKPDEYLADSAAYLLIAEAYDISGQPRTAAGFRRKALMFP